MKRSCLINVSPPPSITTGSGSYSTRQRHQHKQASHRLKLAATKHRENHCQMLLEKKYDGMTIIINLKCCLNTAIISDIHKCNCFDSVCYFEVP